MKPRTLLSVGTPVAAVITRRRGSGWDGKGPYNASGSVAVPAYDLARSPSEQPSERPTWALSPKLRYNASDLDISYTLTLTDRADPDRGAESPGHTHPPVADGWEMCHFLLEAPVRNSTTRVPVDCRETMSPECISMVNKAGASCESLSDEQMQACAVAAHSFVSLDSGNWAFDHAVGNASIEGGGVTSPNLNVTDYDKKIRRQLAYYTRWIYKNKTQSESLSCFGLDTFANGSRTLAEALRDRSDNETGSGNGTTGDDKPDNKSDGKSDGKGEDGNSADAMTALSWAAGLVAFSLAL